MADRGKLANMRYAVVGLGHLAQIAVLPGFQNAPNSELFAIVSGDARKRDKLGRTGESSISARQTENRERQVAFGD
jgi:predicted dehydrogenase